MHTFALHVRHRSDATHIEPLTCAGLSEAMHCAQKMIADDDGLLEVEIHSADWPVVIIGRNNPLS